MIAPEELKNLIYEVTEHLRYYEELGITHFGEAAPVIESPPKKMPAEISQTSAATSNSTPIITPPIQPTVVSEPIKAMAGKKSSTPSTLFGGSEMDPSQVAPILPEQQIPDDSIEKIRDDLGECQRCKLWKTRTNIVFGEGSHKAELMFVGEAPGADEDASGRPFVGRAGQLLTKMIEAINYQREDVYIANILKSRPPENRNPEADEIKACIPFLYRQIAVIRPKLIVTLGNPATQGLLATKLGITKLRGEFQDYPRLPEIKVLPTFHPAYLLRSPDKKREAWEDLKKVRAFMKGEITI